MSNIIAFPKQKSDIMTYIDQLPWEPWRLNRLAKDILKLLARNPDKIFSDSDLLDITKVDIDKLQSALSRLGSIGFTIPFQQEYDTVVYINGKKADKLHPGFWDVFMYLHATEDKVRVEHEFTTKFKTINPPYPWPALKFNRKNFHISEGLLGMPHQILTMFDKVILTFIQEQEAIEVFHRDIVKYLGWEERNPNAIEAVEKSLSRLAGLEYLSRPPQEEVPCQKPLSRPIPCPQPVVKEK